MKHVVLDTNIFRSDSSFESPSFRAFNYLCRFGFVQLHVPYIVYKEFTTFLEHSLEQELKVHTRKLKKALKTSQPTFLTLTCINHLEEIENNVGEIIKDRLDVVDFWLLSTKAIKHELNPIECSDALEAYFHGHPPFKTPKTRNDIPDSIIFQSILSLYKEYRDDFCAIVQDAKLRDACSDKEIENYTGLKQFLESDYCKESLREWIIEENFKLIREKLDLIIDYNQEKIFEKMHKELTENYDTVFPHDFIEDAVEVVIDAYGEIEKYDSKDYFSYLGDGTFEVPIEASIEVEYTYEDTFYVSSHFQDEKEFVSINYTLTGPNTMEIYEEGSMSFMGSMVLKFNNFSVKDIDSLLNSMTKTCNIDVVEFYHFRISRHDEDLSRY